MNIRGPFREEIYHFRVIPTHLMPFINSTLNRDIKAALDIVLKWRNLWIVPESLNYMKMQKFNKVIF